MNGQWKLMMVFIMMPDLKKSNRTLSSAHPETRNFGRDQGMRKILPQAYS
jgi:hypothetical protein